MHQNPELLLIKNLNTNPTLQSAQLAAYLNVPETLPQRFITIEQVGWLTRNQVSYAALAVQVWAETRLAASKLAHLLARVLEGQELVHPQIAGLEVDSVYNFPDPVSRQSRYQLTVTVALVAADSPNFCPIF